MKRIILIGSLLASSLSFAASSPVYVAQPVSNGDEKNLVQPLSYDDQLIADSVERAKASITYLKRLADRQSPDLWLYNPSPEKSHVHSAAIKKVRRSPPPASEAADWLALTPGEVLFYRGAFNVKHAAHVGTYLGDGKVFDNWAEESQRTGVLVINDITNFGPAGDQIKSLSVKGLCSSQKSCIKVADNKHRQVRHVRKDGKRLKRTYKEMVLALRTLKGGKVSYNPLYNNCINKAASLSGEEQDCLSASLQTFHFNCQKTGERELRSCQKAAFFLKWGTGALVLAKMFFLFLP